jgi:hypothetical protein
MPLINGELRNWKINRLNVGPPFRVEVFGPYSMIAVCDERGTNALSGPDGAVLCASMEQAKELCAMANSGELECV